MHLQLRSIVIRCLTHAACLYLPRLLSHRVSRANKPDWRTLQPAHAQDDGAQPQPETGPVAAKAKKAKKAEKAMEKSAAAAEKEAEERRLAELQLLMMDDETLRRPAPAAPGLFFLPEQ